MQSEGIALEDIDDDVVASFAEHRCECPGGRKYRRVSRRYVARLRPFLRYLRQQLGVSSLEEKPEDEAGQSLDVSRTWLLRHRGLSSRTIDRHERLVMKMLPVLGSDPAEYDAATIRRAILIEVRRCSRAQVKSIATALRVYLRFLAAQGECRPGLDAAVPTVPEWKLSSLARYLIPDDVERVIASCDTHEPVGIHGIVPFCCC